MAIREYAKLFYDLKDAKAFGSEVDFVALSDKAKVSRRNRDGTHSIFVDNIAAPNAEEIGTHHIIEKDQGSSDIYYVKYTAQSPRGSSNADFELAKRYAEAHLNAKYEELGPDAGVSRA